MAENRKIPKRRNKYATFFGAKIESEQQIADTIGRVIPSENLRRRPGFDLASWRKANGVVDRLKATKQAKRAKAGMSRGMLKKEGSALPALSR